MYFEITVENSLTVLLITRFFHIFPQNSMSQVEVDSFDAPEKPFKLPESSEPSEASPLRDALLGKTSSEETEEEAEPETEAEDSESEEQQKSNSEGLKVVDRYSAKIQEKAEELYATEERLSLKNEGYLDKLLSGDATDRKYAAKILKRNADTFGASTVEDYQKKKAVDAAGDDPTARKLAATEVDVQGIKERQRGDDWKSWKGKQKVDGDFEAFADEVWNEYGRPTDDKKMADVLHVAKGRMGHSANVSHKSLSSFAAGGGMPTETDDPFSSPLARKLLKNPKETKKFAKNYLREVGGF